MPAITSEVNTTMQAGDDYRGPAKSPADFFVTEIPAALRGGKSPTINVAALMSRSVQPQLNA